MTGHVLIACLQWFTSVTKYKTFKKKQLHFVDFCPLLNGSLLVDIQQPQVMAGMVTLQPQVDEVGGCI